MHAGVLALASSPVIDMSVAAYPCVKIHSCMMIRIPCVLQTASPATAADTMSTLPCGQDARRWSRQGPAAASCAPEAPRRPCPDQAALQSPATAPATCEVRCQSASVLTLMLSREPMSQGGPCFYARNRHDSDCYMREQAEADRIWCSPAVECGSTQTCRDIKLSMRIVSNDWDSPASEPCLHA